MLIKLRWPDIDLPKMKAEKNISIQFLQGMIDATATGVMKYGAVVDEFPQKMDSIANCKLRLETYRKTHNKEYLIDAANYLMYEFLAPKDPAAYYQPTDSDASPGRVERFTGTIVKK